jgi:UDP-N-acetylmuramoyl-L-alanyl-D-glutamate--2,6-diaminopimelate ligase
MSHVPIPPRWAADLLTIGVTGTNGKTSCCLWTGAALEALAAPVPVITSLGAYLHRRLLDTPRNYAGLTHAIKIGYDEGARFAVIEYASWSLAQGFAKAWPCRIAMFTNITAEHFDIHGGMQSYVASKAMLFASLPADGTAILNAADPHSSVLRAAMPRGASTIYYGSPSRGCYCVQPDVEACVDGVDLSGTRFVLHFGSNYGHKERQSKIRAIGHVFVENATAALCAALAAGVPVDRALAAIECAEPPPGRFEVLRSRPVVILDFAHTPDALARTLVTARELCEGRVLVVFGAGGDRDRLKRPLLGAAALDADVVFVTSDNPRNEDPAGIINAVHAGLRDHPRAYRVLDRRAAIEQALAELASDDLLVIAGRGADTHQNVGDSWIPLSDADIVTAWFCSHGASTGA